MPVERGTCVVAGQPSTPPMNNEHDYERSSLQPHSVVSSGGACGSLLPGLINVGPRTTVHVNLQQTLDPGTVDHPSRRDVTARLANGLFVAVTRELLYLLPALATE